MIITCISDFMKAVWFIANGIIRYKILATSVKYMMILAVQYRKTHLWVSWSFLLSSHHPLPHLLFRYGQPGGAGAGGARLPHALSAGMPWVPAWDDEALLEEGARREAHIWVPAVFPGGLFHRHRATVSAWREPIAYRQRGQELNILSL